MHSFRRSAASLIVITGLVASSAALAADGDLEITDQVKSKIASAINFDTAENLQDGISVETSHGVVSLRGYVDSVAQKKEAGKIARGVAGVQHVRNGLVVSDSRRGKND